MLLLIVVKHIPLNLSIKVVHAKLDWILISFIIFTLLSSGVNTGISKYTNKEEVGGIQVCAHATVVHWQTGERQGI